ncbi:hypothetical protein [Pseudanabaena sp. ABRG5-3]|uniref:hypothetical protein n=1 Tax=Pseudanabaena sp. ABRG5-3 TaxID=685565 RepID=UPI000DC72360|nr:hypothetical protein [Pseudanabaena sp. ABRG5-3]BBC23437.1 hypothetical protein ABRG53_1180 [Pseudanabaena sp. ABRG5-3]
MLDPVSSIASISLYIFDLPPLVRLDNKSFIQSKTMTQNSQIIPFQLSVILLEAYEDQTPPPGASSNHPVGHAVVRFRIENLTQNNIIANLIKIELRQASNQEVLISQTLNPLEVGGLQILEQGFHLTNPNYLGLGEVKAVLFYEFNSTQYTMESDTIKVRVNL